MFEQPGLSRLIAQLARRTSNDPHDSDVRMVVRARAHDACEYCLMPTRSQFHVEHIIPKSQWSAYRGGEFPASPQGHERGPNHLDNFAWSCSFCNNFKSNTVAGEVGRQTYALFHPRRDVWRDHFVFTDRSLLILGVTGIGQATERTLRFNDPRPNGPLTTRHGAILDGIYPPDWARV